MMLNSAWPCKILYKMKKIEVKSVTCSNWDGMGGGNVVRRRYAIFLQEILHSLYAGGEGRGWG